MASRSMPARICRLCLACVGGLCYSINYNSGNLRSSRSCRVRDLSSLGSHSRFHHSSCVCSSCGFCCCGCGYCCGVILFLLSNVGSYSFSCVSSRLSASGVLYRCRYD
jgi:hypothetical protein